MASFAVAGVFTIRRYTGKMMGKGGGGCVHQKIMDDYEKGVWTITVSKKPTTGLTARCFKDQLMNTLVFCLFFLCEKLIVDSLLHSKNVHY